MKLKHNLIFLSLITEFLKFAINSQRPDYEKVYQSITNNIISDKFEIAF